MNKIKKWFYNRSNRIEKSAVIDQTVPDFILHLEESLGKNAVANLTSLVKSPLTSIFKVPQPEVLQFIEKFQKNADFAKAQLDSQRSNFHKDLLKKSVAETAQEFSSILKNISLNDLSEDLNKAVQPKDFKRLTSKHNQDAELKVDHKTHLQQFPVHSEYSQLLSDPKTFKQHQIGDNGISAKMIHNSTGYTDNEGQWTSRSKSSVYMAKPYHKNIESATKSWVKHPILGWSTMATKALFNAGNIGHLAEDVSAHEHEGLPLTVHKFADNHYSLAQVRNENARKQWNVKPLDVHQIGVMDYLTNNLDRHHGNIMINDTKDEEGYNPLLAIDHERNFQYSKHLREHGNLKRDPYYVSRLDPYMKQENPLAYVRHQATGTMAKQAYDWFSHHDLVDWWSNHGKKIKDELESQVEHIKDEPIRKHVRENFNNRWHKMNNWAERMKADPEGTDIYRLESLGDTFENTHNTKLESPRISAKELKLLPKNKKDALLGISDIINRKEKLTYKQHSILSSAIDNLINQMSPEEAAETFRSIVDNPYMKTKAIKKNPELDPRQRMLRHFSDAQGWTNEGPQYKYAHMQAMADTIDALPAEKKEMLKYWADHYRQVLSEKEERQVS
jgi:hypothetical protein